MVIREERSACLEMISEVYWGLNSSFIQRDNGDWKRRRHSWWAQIHQQPSGEEMGECLSKQIVYFIFKATGSCWNKEVLWEAGHTEEGVWTQWFVQIRGRHPLHWYCRFSLLGIWENWQSKTLTFQQILTLVVWEPAWATLRSDTKIYVRCQDGNRSISAVKWSNLWWHLQQGPSQWNWGDNDSFKY